MTVHMRSELIWPASLAIILQSRHDLEVRSLISRMRRLSACAQGAKRIDSKASMSALGWLHQEGGAWQCGAVSRSASGSKHVQGRSASESGHAVSLLTAARVSSITRHRAAVLRVMQGEARAARAGEAFCARVVRCCCCASARRPLAQPRGCLPAGEYVRNALSIRHPSLEHFCRSRTRPRNLATKVHQPPQAHSSSPFLFALHPALTHAVTLRASESSRLSSWLEFGESHC